MGVVEWFLQNIELVLLLISNPLTWVFTSRHMKKREIKEKDVNIEQSQSEVVSKNLELYQRMLDDVENRYQENIKKRDIEIQRLEQEVLEWKKRTELVEQELLALKDSLK